MLPPFYSIKSMYEVPAICVNTGKAMYTFTSVIWERSGSVVEQSSHRLEKYLNIQECLEKSLKINCDLKSS